MKTATGKPAGEVQLQIVIQSLSTDDPALAHKV